MNKKFNKRELRNNKKNEKLDKKLLRENYITEQVNREAKERIEEIEIHSQKELNERDKARIKLKIERRIKRVIKKMALVSALSGLLGLSTGIGLEKFLLESRNRNQAVEEDVNTYEKGLKNHNRDFIRELRDTSDRIAEIKKTVEQEITAMKVEKEVINYFKDIFIEDYNKDNDDKITSRDELTIMRRSGGDYGSTTITYYEDIAENGDTILRLCTVGGAERDGIRTIPERYRRKLLVASYNGKEELATAYAGEYVRVYKPEEKVSEYSDNSLCHVANIVYKGIHFADIIENEETKYVDRRFEFIDAVIEYRTNKYKNQVRQAKGDLQKNLDKTEEER